MKVLHVVQGYAPAVGGTERLIQCLSERLVARHGDEVTVFTTTALNCELFWRRDRPSLPEGTERCAGVTVRRFAVSHRALGLRKLLSRLAWKFRLPFHDRLRTLENGPLVPGLTAAISECDVDVICASSFPLRHMYLALDRRRAGGYPRGLAWRASSR